VPPVLVVGGAGHRELMSDLVGLPAADQAGSAFVVLRHGRAGARSHIPGHRDPRVLNADGTPAGPATRPPRRVTLTGPVRLLQYVQLVLAPEASAGAAGTAVLVDAVHAADGLVWVLDAREPLDPELATLAASARKVALVDRAGATPVQRAAIMREIPDLALATWHDAADLAALKAELTAVAWLEPSVAEGAAEMAAEAARSISEDEIASPVRVTDDDQRWRTVLADELRRREAAERERVTAGLATIAAAGAGEPRTLATRLDAELHALSLRTTDGLDVAARGLIGAVFAEVVAGRLTDAVRARIVRAVRRHVEPDERTLLVTATAGVALVRGTAGALSATGAPAVTVLPPIGAAVSGSCHLMWLRRAVPDEVARGPRGDEWLARAVAALEAQLVELLAERFAALREAVEALAADAVDHGVLLA
jgi:hypothetical protein